MSAAIAYVRDEGILGGFNVSTIAGRVGVTPANVYHLFGSRRGLLRAAIHRETEQLVDGFVAAGELPLAPYRLAVFDLVTGTPALGLNALLALDDDPDYEPLPYVEATFARYQEMVAAGDLPEDLDVEALHLLTLATAMGVSLFADAAARQIGEEPDAVVARVRALLLRLLKGLDLPEPQD